MKQVLLLLLMIFAIPAYSWDGYDWETGSEIEIEKGTLVREGCDIDVFDYSTGEYKTFSVENISDNEIEVFDWDNAEYRFLDMD